MPNFQLFSGKIYLITNLVNNKKYVGQTKMTILKRWGLHKSDAKKNNCNMPLYYAINKYGIDNFFIEELETVEANSNIDLTNKLNYREIFYIKLLNTYGGNNGYNATTGGGGTPSKIVSEETREKIRQTKLGSKNPMYGKKWSEEKRKQMTELMTGEHNHNFGIHLSDETKVKLSEKLIGREITDEWKEKISNTMKGVPKTPETIAKMKIAKQTNPSMKGKKHKPETIEKLKQMRHTEETKINMKDSQQLRRDFENECKLQNKLYDVHLFNDDPLDFDQEVHLLNYIYESINHEIDTRTREQKISDTLKQYNKDNPREFKPRGHTLRDPNLSQKICGGPCKQLKSIDNFLKKNDTADGFQPWCKICVNEAKKLSRSKTKLNDFKCTSCDKVYKLKDSLTRHVREKHSN